MEKIRCFLAIEIPEEIKKKIIIIAKEINGEGIKPVTEENLHITLKFLGEVSPEKVERIKKRLAEFQFASFSINIKGVGVFPNEEYIRVVWVGCESKNKELEALAEKMNSVLAREAPKEEFTPHLTIARAKKKLELQNFLKKHKEEMFGSFVCKSFELKQSVLQRSGPVYTTLATIEGR